MERTIYMKNFDSRTYSINDFAEWNRLMHLELSPKFQRRTVWSPQAKSYLIDTVIRGKPIPKIFIRSTTDPETRITIREMVDGQQRIRAILDFLEDGFKISKVHNKDYGGFLFSELPKEIQKDFLTYELSVDLLIDLDDSDILDIFARLNAYSVKLNRQELLNAKFFGAFKLLVYNLGYEYTKFWTDNGIFSHNNVMRMQEAALTSDIVASIVENALVDSKNMEKYYKKYDEMVSNEDEIRHRFHCIMDYIGAVFSKGGLKDSSFSRQPLFFSLFMAFYHMNYGIEDIESLRKTITNDNIAKVRDFIDRIDSIVSNDSYEPKYQDFIASISKATTDQKTRYVRTLFLCNELATSLV